MVQAKLGRGDDAIASFRKAVELEPRFLRSAFESGNRAGRPLRSCRWALKEFSEAVRLDPKSAAAHFNLGRFYFESSNYDDARKELETANALQPRFANALYQRSLDIEFSSLIPTYDVRFNTVCST